MTNDQQEGLLGRPNTVYLKLEGNKMKTWLALLMPLMFSYAVEVPPTPDGNVDKLREACEDLGFTQALSCSTCKNIEDIVANEGKEVLL